MGKAMKRRSKAGGESANERRTKSSSTTKRSPKPYKAPNPTVRAADEAGEIARLSRELSEALERQSATSQVLQVISSFAGKLGPVFQAILANATCICEAKFGVMQLLERGCRVSRRAAGLC
jgi:hypothetical protein